MPLLSVRLLYHSLLFCLLRSSHAYITPGLQAREVPLSNVADSYDYIIVGGGQSGLVVANRLSEDTSKTVLVVEYGYFNNDPAQLEPSSAIQYSTLNLFNESMVPQAALNNRSDMIYAASVVGGGSAINGMLFDRGSAEDYNNWERLGNPGWGFDGLLPYFKKSTTFTPPRAELAEEFNITWDANRAYGNGPIQVTFPDWQWPALKTQWKGWDELGIQRQIEGNAGDAFGTFWVPTNNDQAYRRSYSRNAYYDPVKDRRNLAILTGQRVNRVVFDKEKRARGVIIQERGTSSSAPVITIKAKREIIVSAGWLNTPLILQRSGIGPKNLLIKAGIDVVVDLPGVGSNLQDHPVYNPEFQYKTDLQPNAGSLYSNATFLAWAKEQWKLRKGPLSSGVGSSLATIPHPIMNPGWKATLARYKAQDAANYLPITYTASQIKGYKSQRDLLYSALGKKNNGVIEVIFRGAADHTAISLEKPSSRGTVFIDTINPYGHPIIDYNTNVNPFDVEIMIAALKFFRKFHATLSMQTLTPVEVNPGSNTTTDAQIATFLANTVSSSTMHSCGTAAMAPRELAGVVSPELMVYGVDGLSVADISIIPLIPATHTCSTVYAIAEKAADLIKTRNARRD